MFVQCQRPISIGVSGTFEGQDEIDAPYSLVLARKRPVWALKRYSSVLPCRLERLDSLLRCRIASVYAAQKHWTHQCPDRWSARRGVDRRSAADRKGLSNRLYTFWFRSLAKSPAYTGLREGLRGLGYVEGQNLLIELRSAERKRERYAAIAAELV